MRTENLSTYLYGVLPPKIPLGHVIDLNDYLVKVTVGKPTISYDDIPIKRHKFIEVAEHLPAVCVGVSGLKAIVNDLANQLQRGLLKFQKLHDSGQTYFWKQRLLRIGFFDTEKNEGKIGSFIHEDECFSTIKRKLIDVPRTKNGFLRSTL